MKWDEMLIKLHLQVIHTCKVSLHHATKLLRQGSLITITHYISALITILEFCEASEDKCKKALVSICYYYYLGAALHCITHFSFIIGIDGLELI